MLLEETFRLKVNTNAEKETLKFWVKCICKVWDSLWRYHNNWMSLQYFRIFSGWQFPFITVLIYDYKFMWMKLFILELLKFKYVVLILSWIQYLFTCELGKRPEGHNEGLVLLSSYIGLDYDFE